MRVSPEGVKEYTKRKLFYLASESEGKNKALLAEIRKGIGKSPGEDPKLWGILFEEMPEDMMSQNGEPTYAEWAVYTAITLYALHQQGKDVKTENMNVEKVGIGQAVANLITDAEERERIERRFGALATADGMPAVSYYLRGIVQMLRGNGIGLDYAKLAYDLFIFQMPGKASSIRLNWGQDFYRVLNKWNKEDNKNE